VPNPEVPPALPPRSSAARANAVLAIEKLSLALNGRCLVQPLSAQVQPGEVLVVMGASGSGKSSLLAWMAGLLESPLTATGRLRLGEQDITHWPTERRRIGLLFQDDLLFPHLSVLDNLLFAVPAGARSERVARCNAVLERAELAGFGARLPATLSGGQRARVSLMRTLLAEPRAVLLDEPFGKLDATLREAMRSFVWAELQRQAVPAVLVTHDRQDVPAGAQLIELPPGPPAEDQVP
jgi:putative thiamine transport system ATP-binding protein